MCALFDGINFFNSYMYTIILGQMNVEIEEEVEAEIEEDLVVVVMTEKDALDVIRMLNHLTY